ncbi:DUF2017 domain-containing protein [Corynebacterium sp. TAE3-ERU12]|uniref:DUF2017 domain-containing protein n=1 Tax=Corynebacterium sp. TAE3-ERU12 TaxID=2849491 RepID=UPI001C45B368|nr:DUF2017 domain-containing protein [Corynebacterium sp. TAE3-ERU12]MBV7294878.1 DUF2017 domain-containing protein [Corynebacterium sp. TAE3-ERU12]
MQPWKRKRSLLRGGIRYQAVLEPQERQLLGELAVTVCDSLMERARTAPKDELSELTGMVSGHSEAPDDPRLARLLPDFEKPDDEQYDGENAMLRSLHESDITRGKLEQLRTVIEALEPADDGVVTITEEQAHAWLAAINDLRLYLHASLENLAGPMEHAEQTDMFYQWLTYNQESLVEELMRA